MKQDLDPEGQLVALDHYEWFQEELQRYHPDLVLAFDRTVHRWCIARKDLQTDSLKLSEGEYITWARPIWTVILDIRWDTIGEYNELVQHYREPSAAILRKLLCWTQRGQHDQFTRDNSKTLRKTLRNVKKLREESDKEVAGYAEAVVKDGAPFADRTMVQVP